MALSTQQLREAWAVYECREERMVEVAFGSDRIRVAPPTVEAWQALDAILQRHGYELRPADTDSYNCRAITGGTAKSLHAYGIALDVNWTTNPYLATPDGRAIRFSDAPEQGARAQDVKGGQADTDMTADMIADLRVIATRAGETVFTWGGDWKTVKDAMHFQIALAPDDLAAGIDWRTVKGGRPAQAPSRAGVTPAPGAAQDRAPSSAFLRLHAVIEKWEGGFVNDPQDPGGATNMGITAATLARWRGGPVSVDDVRALTRGEARTIFHEWYWRKLRCDELPDALALMTYNAGVNCGVARGAGFLQRALNAQGQRLAVDGVVGRRTLAAASRVDAARAVADFADGHEAYYRGLALFSRFGRGWLNRLADVEARALGLLDGASTQSTAPPPLSQSAEPVWRPGEASPTWPDQSHPGGAPAGLPDMSDFLARLEAAADVLRKAGLTQDVALTAIDKMIGGSWLAGKKTLIAAAAYVILVLVNQAGFLGGPGAPNATYDALINIVLTFGGLGIVSKFERALRASGLLQRLLQGVLTR